MKLKGKVAIITGANRGLGEAISQAYANEGASLLLAAREARLLQQVAEALPLPAQKERQQIIWQSADIARQEEINVLVQRALDTFGKIDILVNNAGVYGPIGSIEEVDWDEWCNALQINLFGTIMMSRAVIPTMKQQGYGKIINLSGGGATAPLPRFSAYAASKSAIVRLTETMAQELVAYKIDVNAIAPGALNTRLLDQVLEAGPERAGDDFYRRSLKQREEGGTSMEKGAELAVFLASDESDGLSGRLISAVWDDWRRFADSAIIQKIMNSDVYTLRRIVPEDRWKI